MHPYLYNIIIPDELINNTKYLCLYCPTGIGFTSKFRLSAKSYNIAKSYVSYLKKEFELDQEPSIIKFPDDRYIKFDLRLIQLHDIEKWAIETFDNDFNNEGRGLFIEHINWKPVLYFKDETDAILFKLRWT